MNMFEILTEEKGIVTLKGDNIVEACKKAGVKPMQIDLPNQKFVDGLQILKKVNFDKVNNSIDFLKEFTMIGNEYFSESQRNDLLHLFSMVHHIRRSSNFAYKAHKTL